MAAPSLPVAAPAVVPSLPAQLSVTLDNGFAGEFYAGFIGESAAHRNPQNLTAAGVTDWRTWGENTNTLTGDDRKVGGAGISDLTNLDPEPSISLRSLGNLGLTVGNGASTVPFSFGWTNGTPVASAVATRAGLQHNNNTSSLTPGYGFSFTVPANASTQRLTLWVSAHHGTGKLTATLGGITQTDLGVSGGQNHGGVYTIQYSGDGTPGQTLNVSFVLDSAVTPSSTPDEVNLPSNEANVVIYAAALSLISTPPSVAIYQATKVGTEPAIVSGRLTGNPSTDYTMRFRTASSCDSAPDGADLGTMSTATTGTGSTYFQNEVLPGTALQTFVVAQVVGVEDTPLSDWSSCIVAGPDNDSWPRALEIGPGSLTGYVDDVGRARWYKVPIQPGSRVHVNVTNLPADFDMFLFTDIGQAFAELASTDDLTRLSAEFAPSAFSPSAFSPSAFSPSAFSPSAFSPSAFSPSAFSPSAFSPSAFSPSAFSPSAFSPSAFSPSAFSPSAFSPSAFSPSAFSPSAFSPSAFSAETYASAQIRSLITGSAATGLTNEAVVADTWNNTGYFYIRVNGKNGAFSNQSPFTLGVTLDPSVCDGVFPEPADSFSANAGGYETLVLTDFSRMPSALAGNSTADKAALLTKLTTFNGRGEIDGAVEDVGTHPRIQALNSRADSHSSCMYAKNLVADAIYDVIAEYREKNPGLKYIVIVGGDGAIPFFRYPDQTLLGPESEFLAPVLPGTASNASLRANYVLGQDGYGASFDLSLHGSAFPIPDLPVGRLVETAAEASGMIDAYLTTTDGTVATATKSLVTGYDFLSDAATAVQADLAAGTGGTPDTLISAKDIAPGQICDAAHPLPNCSWNATAMRNSLLNSRHDLVFLAGHFSANNALAADFQTTMSTADLAASNVNLVNAIVFSAGCHSGYNVVDPDAVPGGSVDWAQTLARKRATFVGGTGYQYGDTDFLEYSERIYAEFAHQLRVGDGPVSIGNALKRAKEIYLASTPDIRGLHTKALLESAIFGLPMLSVDMPGTRDTTSGPGSIISAGDLNTFAGNPRAVLGLRYVDPPITWELTPHTVVMNNLGGGTVTAKYYSGPNGVVTNPGEPAIPVVSKNVSVAGEVLRGIGFRGGSYTDETLIPLTGAPADPDKQLRGIHRGFASPVFFPMRLATPNYFGALSGGSTNLLITPAQHRGTGANDGSAVMRRYSSLDLRLFYSDYVGASAASGAPTITSVNAVVAGGFVTFSARAFGDPSAGMQQVWVTYTGQASTPNTWTSVDLDQVPTDSTLWTKAIPLPAAESGRTIDFLVQAVNGVGLVSLDDNLGRTYSVLGAGQKATQTVTIGAPAVKALGDPDFSVSAASTSGLPVTLAAAGVCTVSGTTVHITGGGICTLTGTQLGSAVYNPATGTATIQVRWPFTGFFSPVDNPPIDNVATAGSAIPVKFSLGGNRGLGVLVAGSPTATKFTCGTEATDLIEELVTATASSFTYDAAAGQYKYIWKTPKTYAGLCYQLKFTFVDGATQVANFKFK